MEQTQTPVQSKTPAQSKTQAPSPAPPGAQFQELKPATNGTGGQRDMDFLLDVPLEITVELGRTRMLIKDLLQLGQGSVVELQKIAGEPMEVLVNNKLVARGEVVVVNEKFGVRLTDIISPTERIQQLK
jgi:flagellar motor switch protein FliN/FliY